MTRRAACTGTGGRALAAGSPTVVEWPVLDGDPVSPGQPLVRLHPSGSPA